MQETTLSWLTRGLRSGQALRLRSGQGTRTTCSRSVGRRRRRDYGGRRRRGRQDGRRPMRGGKRMGDSQKAGGGALRGFANLRVRTVRRSDRRNREATGWRPPRVDPMYRSAVRSRFLVTWRIIVDLERGNWYDMRWKSISQFRGAGYGGNGVGGACGCDGPECPIRPVRLR